MKLSNGIIIKKIILLHVNFIIKIEQKHTLPIRKKSEKCNNILEQTTDNINIDEEN